MQQMIHMDAETARIVAEHLAVIRARIRLPYQPEPNAPKGPKPFKKDGTPDLRHAANWTPARRRQMAKRKTEAKKLENEYWKKWSKKSN
jgi:hypothetical protein